MGPFEPPSVYIKTGNTITNIDFESTKMVGRRVRQTSSSRLMGVIDHELRRRIIRSERQIIPRTLRLEATKPAPMPWSRPSASSHSAPIGAVLSLPAGHAGNAFIADSWSIPDSCTPGVQTAFYAQWSSTPVRSSTADASSWNINPTGHAGLKRSFEDTGSHARATDGSVAASSHWPCYDSSSLDQHFVFKRHCINSTSIQNEGEVEQTSTRHALMSTEDLSISAELFDDQSVSAACAPATSKELPTNGTCDVTVSSATVDFQRVASGCALLEDFGRTLSWGISCNDEITEPWHMCSIVRTTSV